jgi:hypothetical protein
VNVGSPLTPNALNGAKADEPLRGQVPHHFKFNHRAIQQLVLKRAKHREAA